MISTSALYDSVNWEYLGEGKVHIIFGHEVKLRQRIISECTLSHEIEVVSSTRSCRDGRNRVLRVTKKCHGKEDILQDELFLRNVIKPWFGGAICSDRRLVEIPAGFLGSEHSYCSLQMRSQL